MKPNEPTKVQGEGDYESNRRYTEAAQSFAKSGKVEDAARNAAPRSQEEQQQMESAERTGESHSKGEDPVSARSPVRKNS